MLGFIFEIVERINLCVLSSFNHTQLFVCFIFKLSLAHWQGNNFLQIKWFCFCLLWLKKNVFILPYHSLSLSYLISRILLYFHSISRHDMAKLFLFFYEFAHCVYWCVSNTIISIPDKFNQWSAHGNGEHSMDTNSSFSTYQILSNNGSRAESVSRSSVRGPPFLCTTCGKSYLQYPSLWRHRRYECQKVPLFQCPYCAYCCKQKAYMKRHVERKHGPGINAATHQQYSNGQLH